jgi:hypothetical protein
MTSFIPPGPLRVSTSVPVDRGTLATFHNSPPALVTQNTSDQARFESEIAILKGEVASAAAHLTNDAHIRLTYNRLVKSFADEMRAKASSGQLSWKQAADEAHAARNAIMETLRARTTPVGRAIAESMKREGKTLNELIARKTLQLFGPSANFSTLTAAQQNQVYAAIVTSAGKANPTVNATMMRMRYAGRALIVLSVAISVYTIATADDKLAAAKKEGAITGAGIAGGIAGGALAGLACGPGAPVCVTIGAFVGGALAAFGVSLAF